MPLEQYKVTPHDAGWHATWQIGDGYDVMAWAKKHRWEAISSWGRDGWDLGSWPLVIIFWRTTLDSSHYEVLEYVEGDVTCWCCPTPELREQVTDSLAFFHWKQQGCEWVAAYEDETKAPPELRGKFSWKRLEE